jgi:hypothetical protein
MKEVTPTKTFIIKHKTTGELFKAASGKTSWKAPGHAKNAWNQTINKWNIAQYGLQMVEETSSWRNHGVRTPLFSEQEVYEVVELKLESETKLDKAKALLNECLGRCNYEVHIKIEEFLKELK